MLSIISFLFLFVYILQTFLFPLLFISLSLSFSAFRINPSLFIFNLAFTMNPSLCSSQQGFNRQEVTPLKTCSIPPSEMDVLYESPVDVDDLGAFGFKPDAESKAQG